MGIFDPKNKKTTRAAVQTAPQPRPEHWQPQRFLPAEAPLYRALRQSIPIIDAALQKIVRLTVDFTLTAAEPEAQPLLSRFAAEVPVGASGRGLAAFAGQYLDTGMRAGPIPSYTTIPLATSSRCGATGTSSRPGNTPATRRWTPTGG